MSSAIPQASLQAVSDELAVTLDDARLLLEQYAEGEAGSQALERVAVLLHTARGVLRMTETHGASLLAEEMEQSCRHLARQRRREGVSDEALEALTRAAVKLPVYVERVFNGGRDIPLVLLPLLNDLRAVRGRPLLSESTLLLLNVGAAPQMTAALAGSSGNGEDVVELAGTLRPRFQLALLGWIRGDAVQDSLRQMHAVVQQLEAAASVAEVRQLWWVAAGVIEALLDGGLEASVALKRLVGQVDREMRRLRTLGEGQFALVPPVDLVNNLLYYVARARTSGTRVSAIRSAFNLADLVPGDAQVEQARQGLSAPSVKLMQTVAQAIREDLGRVKDVLDIFVRTGMQRIEELTPQLELLKKIGDTLGVLGLGDLREIVQSRRSELGELISSGQGPEDESALVGIAAALLGVEDRLEGDLLGMIAPPKEDAAAGAAEDPDDDDSGLGQVMSVVMRECLINLARVKEAVSQVTDRGGDSAALDGVAGQLRGITAGLMMLGKERAAAVVEALQQAIRQLLGTGRPENARLERLADATVAVEYYLETLQAGRSEPLYMLDNAERCLSGLVAATDGPAETVAATQAPSGTNAKAIAANDATHVIQDPPVSSGTAVFSGGPEQLDPELLELFIEEAREETALMERCFPAWRQDETDVHALATLRRSFHTLKGSGRMVGADAIGEFCWKAEILLNRVINGTVERSTELLDALQGCVDVLPALLEQLEVGTTPEADVGQLVKTLEALTQGLAVPAASEESEAPAADPAGQQETDAAVDQTEAAELPEPIVADDGSADAAADEDPILLTEEPEPAPAAVTALDGPDPVLLDIFMREARDHIGSLQHFIDRCDELPPPWPVTEELYRSCHTLNGSVAMARVDVARPLTEALNSLVSQAYGRPARLPVDALSVLRDATARMEALLRHLAEPWRPGPAVSDLVQRLNDQAGALIEPAEELLEDSATISDGLEDDGTGESSIVVEELAETENIEITSEFPAAQELADTDGDAAAEAAEQLAPLSDTTTPEDAAWLPILSLAAEEPAQPAVPPTASASLPYDPEIAGIFAEEAAELLEAADAAVGQLATNAGSGQAMADLQRHLHTLKGGARMAGLAVMGDFSHDLETLLIRVDEGLLARDPDFGGLLQASLDELHRLREGVVTGQQLPLNPPLATQLAAALQGRRLSSGTQTSAVAADPGMQEDSAPQAPSAEAVEEAAAAPAEPVAAEAADSTSISLPAIERIGQLARELAQPPDVATDAPAPAADSAERLSAAAQSAALERRDAARVDPLLLDQLLNNAGEISIFQSRLGQQVNLIQFNLDELGATVIRLREQMRKLELETEAQILFRHHGETDSQDDFDPLELDRYSNIQQLSRSLAETTTDVSSLRDLLQNMVRDTEALLVQQARTATELQDGLMRTRMVPFQRHAPRLARLVRQTALESGKRAELHMHGSGELDRQVLERMLGPLEHMLRNAVVHGIGNPEERASVGKPAAGNIFINLRRDGSEVVVEIADDGRGIDVASVRQKAIERGLVEPGAPLTDEEVMQFILRPGFTTADQLTQSAGRGIGMDVVTAEVARLGGSLRIASTAGRGTTFTIRLPFTLAVTQALIVRCATELYALPLPTVEGVIRISRDELMARLGTEKPTIEYGGQKYRFRHLGEYLGLGPARIPEEQSRVSIILVHAAENSAALIVDEMHDSREIVVKPVGPQLATIRGIAGATILGDGRIAIILDTGILVRSLRPAGRATAPLAEAPEQLPLAVVVDDSITMRRVTQRLLERNGFRVVTAKDGLEAVSLLQDHHPDIILLDVEMPRMDGYEFAKYVRNNADTAEVPIIMITSRVSDKHRARAIEVGVNDYLGKPYQERALLEAVRHQLEPA